MTEVYSARLRTIAREEADRLTIGLAEGVYACMPGPSYETPAEIRMLRTLGADVVGMSTVPEAIVARHGGMGVLGIALVSNAAAGVLGTPITHDEVLEAGRKAAPRLAALIVHIIGRLAAGRWPECHDADDTAMRGPGSKTGRRRLPEESMRPADPEIGPVRQLPKSVKNRRKNPILGRSGTPDGPVSSVTNSPPGAAIPCNTWKNDYFS